MSCPPPPGQNPHNPYAAPPQGGQPNYGYPQQPPQQQMYGYPQPGGIPPFPGGPMQQNVSRMPGQVVTARVLLFVAGSLWALSSVVGIIGVLAATGSTVDTRLGSVGGGTIGIALVYCLLIVGLAVMHIVSASMFGKGRGGTRITAIIAASLNTLLPLLALFGALGNTGGPAVGSIVMTVPWLATAVLTIIFCSLSSAGQWFNRPRF